MIDNNINIKSSGGRNYSIDLLRIIAMIMVVILHFNLFGGFRTSEGSTLYTLLIKFTDHISVVAVNVFIIISSWFLRDKAVNTYKLIDLLITILFWTIVSSLLAYALGVSISVKDIAIAVPVIGKFYEFLAGYIVLYLAAPFLNKMLDVISDREHILITTGACLLFSVLVPIESSNYLYIHSGYHFVWFFCLYLMTSFVKKCKWEKFRYSYIIIYFLFSLGATISDLFNIPIIGDMSYNNIIVTISSFSIFLFFANTRLENGIEVKLISFFAPLSFAVFLIHANLLLERWYPTLNISEYVAGRWNMYLALLFIIVIPVYLCCSILEYIRLKLFLFMKLDKSINRLSLVTENYLDKYCIKIKNITK